MNLVSNAIKYTPDGGKIDVDIEEMEAVGEDSIILRICVSDTGIGISQKYIPHIFEAFTREKNSSESGIMGTGLGLRLSLIHIFWMRRQAFQTKISVRRS